MKKLLNISLLLLVFCVSGSLSCRSLFRPRQQKVKTQTRAAEPGLSASDFFRAETQRAETPGAKAGAAEPGLVASDFFRTETQRAAAMTQARPIPAPTRTVPGITPTGLVAVSAPGSSVISRTYPWPECGIVQLDKVMPNEVGLNRAFNYTIKITNLTVTTLTDIVIIENLPDNFKYMSANPSARQEDKKLIWDIPTLGPKAHLQYTVSGMAINTESLKHSTTVITPVIPATAVIEVIQPELKLSKSAPAEVLLCDLIPIRYVVRNSGTGSIQNVQITENLPAGLRTTDGKGQLVFDAGTLGAGQSRQFTVELRATQTGSFTSSAVASSTTSLRVESEATTTSVGMPILAITKSGPDHLYIGRPAAYEITIRNNSDVSAKDTVLEDAIPSGVTGVEATAGAKLSGSKLVWEFGTLEPNSSKNVRVNYTPTQAGTLLSTATAKAYCAEAVTSTMRTTVTGIPALSLEVVDIEDPVRIGSRATYIIRVENQGSATATNIRIACLLEHNVQYISSAGATAGSQEGQTVRFFPLGSLSPKAQAAWRVVVEAVRPGDVRFKAVLNADQLNRPVEETESTHIYD
ncbi:MAG: DUF11 domain-containing protein [Sedimentisphaerales bacterium]|nr:DUF11 domain-containing protein [Sedimentisphaerales bacterium]